MPRINSSSTQGGSIYPPAPIETGEEKKATRSTSSSSAVAIEAVVQAKNYGHSGHRVLLSRHPLNPKLLCTEQKSKAMNNICDAIVSADRGEIYKPSHFNGYKLMDPDIAEGAMRFLENPQVRTDPLRPLTKIPSQNEVSQVGLRSKPADPLRPGSLVMGGPDHAGYPPEINHPDAKSFGHSHPPGDFGAFEVSIDDQLSARKHPNVRHYVKVPDYWKSPHISLMGYTGACPLRHYALLPNPNNYPVPPDSPDNYSDGGEHFIMPPFKPAPADSSIQVRAPYPSGLSEDGSQEGEDGIVGCPPEIEPGSSSNR